MIPFGSTTETVYMSIPRTDQQLQQIPRSELVAQGSISGAQRRRSFIGGSDARVIMGDDEAALLRLWR